VARPQKQTVDYFPHDAKASEGDTLTILQSQFGNDGYAFWFKLLEKVSSSENHIIDCRNPIKWQLLLAKTHTNEELGKAIMDLLCELDAIDAQLWRECKIIWCQNLVNNIADVYKGRNRPVPVRPISATDNLVSGKKTPVSSPDNPQSKVKYSKVNKTIVDKTKQDSSSNSSHIEEANQVNHLSEETAEIARLYEAEIGKISAFVAQELNDTLQNYPADWIKDAIKEAVKQNKRKWSYVRGILNHWKEPGCQGEKTSKADPDKYIKGKYGHMVGR